MAAGDSQLMLACSGVHSVCLQPFPQCTDSQQELFLNLCYFTAALVFQGSHTSWKVLEKYP